MSKMNGLKDLARQFSGFWSAGNMRLFLWLGIYILGFWAVGSSAIVSEVFASRGADVSTYKEIEVLHGGRVTGKVTLTGSVPAPRVFRLDLSPFSAFCEKISDGKGHVLLEEFNVGPDGQLQDTIIAIQGVQKGIPFQEVNANFLATDCMFHPSDVSIDELYSTDQQGITHHVHPLVAILQNHKKISVENKDPIFHNGQVFQSERGNIMLNFALPTSSEPQGGVLHFDAGKKIAQMICGMHEFMQTWGFMVDNPYYTRTKADGEFSIGKLPPGTYKILAWHPNFKPIEKKITVPPDGTVSIDFSFNGDKVKRRIFETREGVRTFD